MYLRHVTKVRRLKRLERCAWLARVREDGLALSRAPERFRDDERIVLAAVRTNGHALHHASERLRDDREIVLAAANARR